MFKFRVTFSLIFLIAATSFAQPEWLTKRPIEKDYFIGINYSLLNESNYIEKAKIRALNELSAEITINLSSITELKLSEINTEVSQSFSENIKSTVSQNITGYQIIDTWQDKEKYWVFIKLSKKEYYEAQLSKAKNALTIANNLIISSEQALANNNFNQSLNLMIDAAIELEPYLLENIESNTKISIINVYNNSILKIKDLLSAVVISVKPNNLSSINAQLNKDIEISCHYSKNKLIIPISSINLTYTSTTGNIQFLNETSTLNEGGKVVNQLVTANFTNNKAVCLVKLNVEDYFIQNKANALVKQVTSKSNNSSATVNIDLVKPTIYFQTDERNFDTKLNVNQIEPSLKEYFKSNGFVFANKQSDAIYLIEILSNTRQGGQAYDLSVAFLDATINITEIASNKQIYSKQFSSIKGVKQDFKLAGNEAYRKLISNVFKETMFQELNQKFKVE